MADPRLWLEDLSVGQRFTSGSYRLDRAEMVAFASQYDPQPYHLDEEAGRASLFGGLAASGWLTGAVTMRLNVDGGLPIAGLVGAQCELSWPRPTYPGDVLRVENEVMEIKPSRSKPDRGMVTMRTITLNQNDEPVQVMTAVLVVYRRPMPS